MLFLLITRIYNGKVDWLFAPPSSERAWESFASTAIWPGARRDLGRSFNDFKALERVRHSANVRKDAPATVMHTLTRLSLTHVGSFGKIANHRN